jgi:hypothetical protein
MIEEMASIEENMT